MPAAAPTRRAVVTALAALPWLTAPIPALATRRARRDASPLLLARDAPAEVDPAGHLVSEKYDGVRALWDGRDLRLRSGLAVAAPRWFTQALPSLALDGELWAGRGGFEAASATVRRASPDGAEWRALRFMVFELPGAPGSFAHRADRIATVARDAGMAQLQAAPQQPVADRATLRRRLDDVVRAGGEGLVLHRADAPYLTGRSDVLLKLKPLSDADAVVVGHEPGHGRLAGRLGALRVRTEEGVEFSVGSGLADAQRASPPPIGTPISFRYRGTTAAGVPRFATFWRLREP